MELKKVCFIGSRYGVSVLWCHHLYCRDSSIELILVIGGVSIRCQVTTWADKSIAVMSYESHIFARIVFVLLNMYNSFKVASWLKLEFCVKPNAAEIRLKIRELKNMLVDVWLHPKCYKKHVKFLWNLSRVWSLPERLITNMLLSVPVKMAK